jgi:hypothetical protein
LEIVHSPRFSLIGPSRGGSALISSFAAVVIASMTIAATLLVTFAGPSGAEAHEALVRGMTGHTSGTPGYRLLGGDGGIFSFPVAFEGSAASDPTRCPANPPGRSMPAASCWSFASTNDGLGYWILNAYDGMIFAYGNAVSYGQPSDTPTYTGGADLWPNAIAIVGTPEGKGYWVLERGLSGLGQVQVFGDAAFYGDEQTLGVQGGHNGTPVAMAATPDGGGYWIVDSDGGVFAFGDAGFYGSMGGKRLNAGIVGAGATGDGKGYWLVASDGGVFSFGDAPFGGSMGGRQLAAPIVGMAANRSGSGYWLAGADGGVFALGGAPFLGSMGGMPLARPVFAINAQSTVG